MITAEAVGMIESIFVLKECRKQSVGEELMQRALHWMEAAHVKTKIVKVAVGNEAVYPFYARYEFYPRVTTLAQKTAFKINYRNLVSVVVPRFHPQSS